MTVKWSLCRLQSEYALRLEQVDAQTVAEIASRYYVHPNQVTQWKTQPLNGVSGVFSTFGDSVTKTEPDIRALHAKIGQQALEIDFSEHALPRSCVNAS